MHKEKNMKRIRAICLYGVICLLLVAVGIYVPNKTEASQEAQTKIPDVIENTDFVLSEEESGISLLSVSNASEVYIKNSRFDLFYIGVKYAAPGVVNGAMAIKYIDKDADSPDALGRWRNVYCLDFKKDSPTGVSTWTGWAGHKVHYAMYYGCVYWGTYSRYAPYSANYYNTSGTALDWRIDYVATQMAIHILNGEFTIAQATDAINKSDPVSMKQWDRNPTTNEKNCLIQAMTKIVNDANSSGNYGGYVSEGGGQWMLVSPSTSKFDITGYKDSFTKNADGNYYADGAFQTTFTSYYGYDMRDQITSMTVSATNGVTVKKTGNATFSDFKLAISENQYKEWQKTGKEIQVTVTMKIPRLWGAAKYTPSDTQFQPIGFMSYSSGSDLSTFQKVIKLHIPKVSYPTGHITITKTDQDSSETLTGAEFSIYAWDGTDYTTLAATTVDQKNGTYTADVVYDDRNQGKFKIVEEKNPSGYTGTWMQEFSISYTGATDQNFTYTATNPQAKQPFTVILTKTDSRTNAPLPGCTFTISEYDQKSGNYIKIGDLAWDAGSQKYVSSQTYSLNATFGINGNQGKFKIEETVVPDGYISNDPWVKEFTVTNTDASKTLEYTFEAKNDPTRILIKKVDENGTAIEGAQLTITDMSGNAISTFLSTRDGVEIHGLKVGATYWVQESKVPSGYVKAEDITFTVENSKDIQTITMTDPWTKTSFEKVTAGNTNTFVVGAVLELRSDKDDPNSVATTITGETVRWISGGQEKIFYGIQPGIYYVVETQTPDGFFPLVPMRIEIKASLTNKAIIYNEPYADLTVVKRIKKNEINFANGDPTFLFTVKGLDMYGNEHIYEECFTFTEAYVKAHTDFDGYVSISHTWDRIPCSAAYQIIESGTNRYTLTSVTSTDANVNISLRETGGKQSFQVTADLYSKRRGTCVVFTNTKDRWGDWSHTSYVKNQIQAKK